MKRIVCVGLILLPMLINASEQSDKKVSAEILTLFEHAMDPSEKGNELTIENKQYKRISLHNWGAITYDIFHRTAVYQTKEPEKLHAGFWERGEGFKFEGIINDSKKTKTYKSHEKGEIAVPTWGSCKQLGLLVCKKLSNVFCCRKEDKKE